MIRTIEDLGRCADPAWLPRETILTAEPSDDGSEVYLTAYVPRGDALEQINIGSIPMEKTAFETE
jgi:hypothetical protein